MRLSIWLLLILQSLSAFTQGEYYNFSKLNSYTGLSHNQVNAILKDSDGFLWFGTMSGLNRYDGYSCRIFRKNYSDSSSLLDNTIVALYSLPDGKIWVVTSAGHCIYDAYTEKFDTDYNDYLRGLGLPPGGISNIIKGSNGRYWFLYNNLDLYLYSVPDKKAKPFRKSGGPGSAEIISSIREAKEDKIWVVFQSGLIQQYDIKSNRVIFSSTALVNLKKGSYPYNLFIDKDGDIWLWVINNGVFLFSPYNNTIRQINVNTFPSALNTNLVSQITQDNNGLIWVATDHGGINLINKKNNLSISYLLNDPKDLRSLSHNSIRTMYKDDNGIIWLGTYKQGINFLNNNIVRFPLYRHQESGTNSLPYDDVNRFVEDRSGNIWIGTNGGGLIFFDRKQNAFKQYLHDPDNKNSLSNNVIVTLWIDHDNILWIGTYFGGLNRFDGKKFTHYRHSDNDSSSLSNDNVWEIFEDREQNLWIGTLGGGMDLFDRQTNRFRNIQNKGGAQALLPSNYVSEILQDRKGDLWVGTSGGIARFGKNKTTSVYYQYDNGKNSLANNNVNCIMEDSKGGIWVGSREGLNYINEQTGKFQTFTISDGLPDNMVLDILEDNQHALWISTTNGLCKASILQKETGLVFSVINYDESNNLQNREFNNDAALKTREGELIFGGPSGFNMFNPEKIQRAVYRPKIILTGLQILNNNVEPGELINNRVLMPFSLSQLQEINLKYKENVFSIEFAFLDFGQSYSGKYAYMMEGFNAEWLYADGNQRRATYTNLNPGSYTFKVKVLNRDGVWSDEKRLQINIEPPFWRTTLAYIIYALIFTALLLLVRRITLDRIHMRYEVQQQRREAERAYSLERLKTKFFTNVSHEFRTPLTLIISPLDKIINQNPDEEQKRQLNLVQRNAKRLLGLVNQLLDFRKMEVQEIKLHPSIGDIISFVKDISDSFMDIAVKKNIQLSFTANIDRLEMYFDRDKIEKILFNLLSNAFKYTHDNGTVAVNLTYNPPANDENEGTLAIEVKDTGIGIPPEMQERIFERFFQTDVPESMVNQGTGLGLAITKEFVKLHKGIITVKSEPEKGTCFTVLLPAKKIHDTQTRTAHLPVETEETEITIHEGQKAGKKKTILVVEDNEDIRFYLKDNLKGHYKVEEATNGKEGWEKIRQVNPDLVVSDIMMPLMDGVELVRKIKTEMLTAHIPVILLTAIGNEEKQLEGLKAGVNDYITKPFTFEILASRIRNLLGQQELLQKRFQKQIEVNPGEITITPVDEKFLKQALESVEKNIDNPEFSVEDFSREMFMNRVTLYRKILSITGKTPIEFIRSIRLKRAAQLLEKSGMTVSQIAFEVGFNNPKNFTKAFKEEFGILPSHYMASKLPKDT